MTRLLIISFLVITVVNNCYGCVREKIVYSIDGTKQESEVIHVTESATRLTILGPIKNLCKGQLKIEQPVKEFIYEGKELEYLEPGVFDQQIITEKISITGGKLKVIEAYTFKGLNIYILDLKNNLITGVEEKAITDMPNLILVIMENNEIDTIHDKAFQKTPRLKEILLDNNKIKVLPKLWFSTFKNLDILKINNNKLITLDDEVLKHNWYRLFAKGNDFDCGTILKLRNIVSKTGFQKLRRKRGAIGDNPRLIGYDEKQC